MMSYQTLADEKAQQDADLTSLRRQLAEAQATPSPAATPAATPAPTPTPAAIAAVVFKEFNNVQFTPTADISDVAAGYSATAKAFAFSSKSLTAASASCAAGSLGTLTRQAKGTANTAAQKVATVGAYDYYYTQPAGSCAAKAGDGSDAIQTKQVAALKAALPTLH